MSVITTLNLSILKLLYLRIFSRKEAGPEKQLKFPRYFIIDGDLPVKVDLDKASREVFAITSTGRPYPPIKTISEGEEITKGEFSF